MKNQVQLCTYVDRLGKGDLNSLRKILNEKFLGLFGAVHLLPFYTPIDGEDAGFDPVDHTIVDPRLGDWSDVKKLSLSHEVLADVIVNHMSSDSAAFQDLLKNAAGSEYQDLFLTFDSVFPEGAREEDLLRLYRPRPGLSFTKMKLADGSSRLFWTTFTEKQIDIDVFSPSGKKYLTNILDSLQQAKVKMIRLDAAGYAVKKAGSNCFMTEDTFDFIDNFTQQAAERGMEVLVEIHSYYRTQVAIAKKANWVYDFALPPLVLHALTKNDSKPLQAWFDMSPRNAITVLDTHDGIGIVDVAEEQGLGPGLLSNSQVDQLVETIHENSGGNSRLATGAAASNVDLYQVNCTFYDALARNDNDYLIARLIQFFSPGIPQVYYVGLLAGENDMELLNESGVGRDINRHYYTESEIDAHMARGVVKHLCSLMRFRNRHPAFQEGEFSVTPSGADSLQLNWAADNCSLALELNLEKKQFVLKEAIDGKQTQINSWLDFDIWLKNH